MVVLDTVVAETGMVADMLGADTNVVVELTTAIDAQQLFID